MDKFIPKIREVFMKSLILSLAGIILIFLGGCGTGKIVTQQDYELGGEKTATVGSTMLLYVSVNSQNLNPDGSDQGTKDEIIYTGKSGNTIKIDYDQYYIYKGEWYLEDGYPLHLEYDLSLGDLITCKYYRIKVLSSDNNEIKFIVIND